MSLRSYLFSLIGCLIALLTLSQLAMLYWIESNIAKEVDFQARHYSEQIIELAVDQLNQVSDPTITITTSKNGQTTKQVVRKPSEVQEFTINHNDNNNNENIEVIRLHDDKILKKLKVALKSSTENEHKNLVNNGDKKVIRQEIKSLVDSLHSKKAEILTKGEYTFVIGTADDKDPSPQFISQHWQTEDSSPRSKELFQTIQVALIIIGLLGIIFAYWLSIQFNKPLKQLSIGFKKLAQGDYQHHVAEQGVKEIRETMQHYNQMVDRLYRLSLAEKQHKEIAHLAELGEVSRGLAHALRNPIHTIGLSIEQLNEDNLSREHREKLLHTIQQKITNIDKNIKGLLTLTTSGISRTEQIPIAAVIQDIMLEYKACGNKSMEFKLDIVPELCIRGAESEIRSILHTLINNACEANADAKKVAISVKEDNSTIDIIIVDQGQGLDKHIEKQLFQPHVSSKPEGAGMGLYIAQRLISLHYNGQITLKNNQDEKHQLMGCIATASFNRESVTTKGTHNES